MSSSLPNSISQESLLNGMACTIGVPAGIKPLNSIFFKTNGKFTGAVYLSVSTTPGSIEKTDSLCKGSIKSVEYPGGVFIDHGFIHLG